MNKDKKTKSYTLYFSFVPVLILGVVILAAGAYSSTKAVMTAVNGKSVLSSQSKGSNPKKNTAKGGSANSNKPLNNNYKPGSNATTYRKNINHVITGLQEASGEEERVGNTDTGQDIQIIAATEEQIVNDDTEAIDEIESRSKWQNLVSPDYKNLGQLRSSLAHTNNNIRKLQKALGSDQILVSGTQVQSELQTLLQERERITNIIKENESQFSVLGWVVKLLTGYDNPPIGSPAGGDGDLDTGTEPGDTSGTGTEPGDFLDTGSGL